MKLIIDGELVICDKVKFVVNESTIQDVTSLLESCEADAIRESKICPNIDECPERINGCCIGK